MWHLWEVAARKIIEIADGVSKIEPKEMLSVISEIRSANRIFVYGVGRSGLMAKAFTMRLMHLGFTAYFADETCTPSAQQGDLLIVCSGSGETGSVKEMAKKAKKLGLKIGLLTIDEASTIGRIADVLIKIPAFSPKRQSSVNRMKRSEVNEGIEWSKKLLKATNITLPEFAYWTVDDWVKKSANVEMIEKAMLGWDITDYGLNKFSEIGGVLFTVRNGNQKDSSIGVPYAEKYIFMREGQKIPFHFHYSKTEDIINRAGGALAIQLYNSKEDESIDYDSDVEVYMDGIKKSKKPGETIVVPTGGSVTLTPLLYHNCWALEGKGDLVIGEVSAINDDNIDNRFNPVMPRFGTIEEDEEIVHPLCNEYKKILVK